MENTTSTGGLGGIVASLAAHSARPRYAFLVLQLLAEAANARGRAGPFVQRGNVTSTIRDWLVLQLMPISGRDGRRSAMKQRIASSLADKMTGDAEADRALIQRELEDQARIVGRQNVSRAISDLVKAGWVQRHYAGYATDHPNRGAGRHAVYVLSLSAMEALGRNAPQVTSANRWNGEAQLQLFG